MGAGIPFVEVDGWQDLERVSHGKLRPPILWQWLGKVQSVFPDPWVELGGAEAWTPLFHQ